MAGAAGQPSRGWDPDPVGSDASLPGGLVGSGTVGLSNRAGGVRYRSTEYQRLFGVSCGALLGGARLFPGGMFRTRTVYSVV